MKLKPHKHAELIKAWADGAEIQYKDYEKWFDTSSPRWDEWMEYRLKPVEKNPVIRWLWACQAKGSDWIHYGKFLTESEAENELCAFYKYQRLDWSRTEFEE